MWRRLLIVFGLSIFSTCSVADSMFFIGAVSYVEDGDTLILVLRDSQKLTIRLSDIDAPEIKHGKDRPGQPYGTQAKQLLQQLTLGRDVAATCYENDRYGRHICRLSLNDIDINAELVKTGLAWANRASVRYIRDRSILDVEHVAQSQKVGLWSSQETPIAPWIWRRACWQFGECRNQEN
jgi:micrococcal nuclease